MRNCTPTVFGALRRTLAGLLLTSATLVLTTLVLTTCAAVPTESPVVASPAAPLPFTPGASTTPRADGLTDEEAATLSSLARVDDYPLYTMRYYGAGSPSTTSDGKTSGVQANSWGCSLFAALGDSQNRLFGRNFDWRFSPALLLFTEPADGYASVSMVDLEYFGFSDRSAGRLVDPLTLPLADRRSLLETPSMPFDGMNVAGVAVGMAALPSADERHDPGKTTIGEIAVMREILDHAGSVDEAVAILKKYNINWDGGPPLHYLVADRSGHAALVEFHGGEIVTMPQAGSWQAATNFTRSAIAGDAAGECPRYDALVRRLTSAAGALAAKDALSLLQSVSQAEGSSTQWSVVYNLSDGQVDIVMGRQYSRVHRLQLSPSRP